MDNAETSLDGSTMRWRVSRRHFGSLLIIIPTLRGGGAERVVSLLSMKWAEERNVTVAAFDARQPFYRFGGRTVNLSSPASGGIWKKALGMLVRTWRVAALIRKERPERIIGFMESANVPAILACMLTNSLGRLLVSVRGNTEVMSPGHQLAIRMLYRFAIRVISVSEAIRLNLIRDFSVRPSRCIALPNPLDLEGIRAMSRASPTRGSPFFLAVGRLESIKGFDLLLRAYASCAARGEVRLVILGDGDEAECLKRLACDLGVADRVDFPGASPNPWSWMARSMSFVLSSRHEGWNNALAEAMACGCAVVAFDCPSGPREMIRDGENGLLVTREDVAALAAALDRLWEDPALRRRLGARAREWSQAFDLTTVAEQWMVLAGGGKPRVMRRGRSACG